MNPIISILAERFEQGKQVVLVTPDCQNHPRGIVIEFNDGETEKCNLAVETRDEFMKIWHQASVWRHLKWDEFN